MALGFIPVENYKKKLYQREKESNYFRDISEERLIEISKLVYAKQKSLFDDLDTYQRNRISKLEKYIRFLKYLISPYIYNTLKTFDERIAFLIMAVDPELVTFKEFMKLDILSIDEIAALESPKERDRLFDIRNQTINTFATTVREKIGFYDPKLLRYEKLFFKKFYNDKELITEVGQHTERDFLNLGKLITSFNSISDERYNELVEKAQIWLSIVTEKYPYKTAAYSVIEQKQLLGLKSLKEQYVFFILVVDGNLDMLRIFEEESRMPIIEERIKDSFGFYDPNLLSLEKVFHKRFCPDKKLSIWSGLK